MTNENRQLLIAVAMQTHYRAGRYQLARERFIDLCMTIDTEKLDEASSAFLRALERITRRKELEPHSSHTQAEEIETLAKYHDEDSNALSEPLGPLESKIGTRPCVKMNGCLLDLSSRS